VILKLKRKNERDRKDKRVKNHITNMNLRNIGVFV
jgi:hypothetical protein